MTPEEYEERLAIMIHEGGLTEEEAKELLKEQRELFFALNRTVNNM